MKSEPEENQLRVRLKFRRKSTPRGCFHLPAAHGCTGPGAHG